MRIKQFLLVICLLVLATLANAQWKSEEGPVRIHGFGTIGATKVESNDRYLSTFQANGDVTNFGNDSLLAVNLTAKINNNSFVNVQPIMFGGVKDYVFELELASITTELFKNFHLFGGRVVAPIWMYSEEQSIGYANIWTRPPVELYKQVPVRHIDSVGVRYALSLGSALLKFQGLVGQSVFKDVDSYFSADFGKVQKVETVASFNDVVAAEVRLELSNLLAWRLGYVQANAKTESDVEVIGGSPGGGPPSPDFNLRFSQSGQLEDAKMYSLGLRSEWSSFLMTAEYAKVTTSGDNFKKYSAAYATLGYLLGNWTFHVTQAWRGDLDGRWFSPTEDSTDMIKSSHSTSLGVNFGHFENVILKVGATIFRDQFEKGKANEYSVYSAAADFIF